MSFLMSGKVLMESQFVVPVVLNVVFALFLISACVESFLQPQLLVRFNFLTFLLFNGMIMLDCLIYLFVEPKLRTLILLRVKRWRLERSFSHNVRKRQLPSPTTTEALAMSVLNFWQYIDALETKLDMYIEPSPKYAKNAKSKHGTSFAFLRVFPWFARPIKEGLGYL